MVALVALATAASLFLLWYFRAVIILFLLSLFTAAAVRPIIERLNKRGLPNLVSISITYLVGAGIAGLWLFVVSRFLIGEVQTLLNQVANRYQTLHLGWLEGTPLQQGISARLPTPERLSEAIAAQDGTILAQALFTIIRSTAAAVGSIVIVLVLSVYWSVDHANFQRSWLSLIPAGKRRRAREMWHAVEDGVGGYIRSEVTLGLLAALLLGAGYLLMGISYPTLLAHLGVVAWLIPIVGFILAAILALLAGLGAGPLIGLAAAGYTLGLFLVLHFIVERRLFRHRRNHSYLLIVLLMIPLADAYGFVGLLAAPPLAVSIESLLVFLFNRRRLEAPLEVPAARVSELEEQLQTVRTRADEAEGDVAPELNDLLQRLAALLQQTRTTLQNEAAASPSPPDETASDSMEP